MTIGQPDKDAILNIDFSEAIRVPSNCTIWDWANEGTDRLKVEYQPSEETITLMYDRDLENRLTWTIA